jgi:hypothetical protein
LRACPLVFFAELFKKQDLIKQRVAQAIRQKRTYENHKMNMDQQVFNMEQQSFAIQSVKDTQVMVNTMESGVKESVALHFAPCSPPLGLLVRFRIVLAYSTVGYGWRKWRIARLTLR